MSRSHRAFHRAITQFGDDKLVYFNCIKIIVYFATSEEKPLLVNVKFLSFVRLQTFVGIDVFHLSQTIFLTTKARNMSFVAPRRTEKYIFRACVVKVFLN